MAFKMKGWSPFKNYKKGYYGEGSSFNKMADPRKGKSSRPVDRNWKKDQSLVDDLKSLKKDLAEATSAEEKRKIKMDIKRVENALNKGPGSYGSEEWDKE